MPLAQQPKEIEIYQLKDEEVDTILSVVNFLE